MIEKDYTLRLSLVAHDWATEHLRAWNAVFAEGMKRGNSAYCGPTLVEMEIADADKRAEWGYRTCCEIWEIQGRAKCRAFFRAIFDWGLQPMFSAREGNFQQGWQTHLQGNPHINHSGILGHMKREMGRLRAKWNTKLEIAARDNEHQQERIRLENLQQGSRLDDRDPTQAAPALPRLSESATAEVIPNSNGKLLPMKHIGAAASAFTWRELENRFHEIQLKPSVCEKVSAEFTRTEWDTGSVTEEWRLRGNSVCRAEFERLATIASRKLGYAGSKDAVDYWLGRVREWMQRTGLDKNKAVAWCPTGCGEYKGETYKTVHLNSERIAELSAMFCVELMALGTSESAVPLLVEQPEIADRQTGPGRTKGKASKTKAQLFKTCAIFGAIQSGLTGQKYCAALDDRKVCLPDQWIEEGCPRTYRQAYRAPRWRKRIQDEKTRHRKQYDQTPEREREAIIQGENGTRRTRR